MKKFKISDDLDQITIEIPLNVARSLITMSYPTAEKATRALEMQEQSGIDIGDLHLNLLKKYFNDYKVIQSKISKAILDNLTAEDQKVIRDYEENYTEALTKEMNESLYDDVNKEEQEYRKSLVVRDLSKTSKTIQNEFDLDSLPEGTVIVPGSKEEN